MFDYAPSTQPHHLSPLLLRPELFKRLRYHSTSPVHISPPAAPSPLLPGKHVCLRLAHIRVSSWIDTEIRAKIASGKPVPRVLWHAGMSMSQSTL